MPIGFPQNPDEFGEMVFFIEQLPWILSGERESNISLVEYLRSFLSPSARESKTTISVNSRTGRGSLRVAHSTLERMRESSCRPKIPNQA